MKHTILFLAAAVFFASAADDGFTQQRKNAPNPDIKAGSLLEEVIAAYGAPAGKVSGDEATFLIYPDVTVKIVDGRVAALEESRSKKFADTKSEIPQEKSAGIINRIFGGRSAAQDSKSGATSAVSPQAGKSSGAKTAAAAPAGQKIEVYREGGKNIELNSLLVKDKITVVDFYADWCGPCRNISPRLEQIARSEPDVYLRKVDIVNWKTPVVSQYNIRSVPNIRVYDRQGKMIGRPTSSLQMVKDNIAKAKR